MSKQYSRTGFSFHSSLLILSLLISSCGTGPTDEEGSSSDLINVPTSSVSSTDAEIVQVGSDALSIVSEQTTVDSTPEFGFATTDEQNKPDPQIEITPTIGPLSIVEVQSAAETQPTEGALPTVEIANSNSTIKQTSALEELVIEQPNTSSNTGCVGNLAWLDANGNGLLDGGESGIAINQIDFVSSNGVVLESKSTSTGYYQFCNLPDRYTVRFEIPNGYAVTAQDIGSSDTADSDANEYAEIEVEVIANRNKTKFDIGFIPLSLPTTNASQALEQEIIENTNVTAAVEVIEVANLNPAFNETTTAEDVEIEQSSTISETGCVGNLAWLDANGNGIKDGTENGIAINQIDFVASDGVVLESKSTSTGYYQFCHLPDRYTVRFEIPTGYAVTAPDIGSSDTADSDANEYAEIEVDVIANKNKTKFDIGFVPLNISTAIFDKEPAQETVAPANETPAIEPVVAENTTQESTQPNPPTDTNNNGTINNIGSVRWGFWTETRNAYQSNLGLADPDEGVETIFENYSFAHVKALSLKAVGGDTLDKQYVVNVINAARETNTSLDLQLGSAGDYGWNFTTGRGNFNLNRWKDSLSSFSVQQDSVAHQAIVEAIADGTIKYIFLIDEPNHKRWSPSWDGTHGSSAPGNSNHVSNQDLDEMAAHAKTLFGANTKTIVRTSPVNLVSAARQGMYVFQHMTHAYLTISSAKWVAGANKGPNKGFEWFLTDKNNHVDNVTNLSAYSATNLKPSIMIQAGFQSVGNPWTGEKNFKSQWWESDIRYPFNGKTSYVKTAPAEMDYWIKSLLSKRDSVSGKLSSSGERWFDEFVIFRSDRLPTDSGKLPFSSYPHYTAFLDQLGKDMRANNLNPVLGIPVGWTGD